MAEFPEFAAGVKNVVAVVDKIECRRIQEKVARLLNWERNGFPGSAPVPMDQENIKMLASDPENFVVSVKWDGVRYLLFIEKLDSYYFVNRNNQVFRASGILPFPANTSSPSETPGFLKDTVLDGEMMEKIQPDGSILYEFHVFDLIAFQGEFAGAWDQRSRMDFCRDQILTPRDFQTTKNSFRHLATKATTEPFAIKLSQHYPLSETERLWKRVSHDHTLKQDGLIFTDTSKPYNEYLSMPGLANHTLKWKPTEVNTVDFCLKIQINSEYGNLFLSDMNSPVGEIKITRELKKLDGEVIECKRNEEDNEWILYRHRWDKYMANNLHTYQNTMRSIRKPVSEDYLLNFIAKNCSLNTAITKQRTEKQNQEHSHM